MNDTTSTPDEPEGRVVTDAQSESGAPDARPPNGTPHAASDGHGTDQASAAMRATDPDGAASSAPGPNAQGDGASRATERPTESPADPAPWPHGVSRAIADPAQSGPAPGSPVAHSAQAATDAPTAQLRIPAAGNGTGPQQINRGGAPEQGGRPEAVPAGVPAPSAAAAGPPPWNRVPGQEPAADRTATMPRPRGPGGLLDEEGSTSFLEASGREAPGPPPGQLPGQPPGQPQPGNWSGARTVRNRPPRQAALQLKRLDPWSVLKLALVLAVVLFFIWLVAVGVLYGVLDGIGVWDRLNGTYADLVSGEAPTGAPLISAGRVFGIAAVVGAINSLLFAVAVTVGAFVYNVSADLVGGIEVTLSERD